MPSLRKVAEEYRDEVIFVGVDVGPFTGVGTHEDARRLIRELDLRYPTAYALDPSPLRKYNVFTMPTSVFLTPDGEIVETHPGVLTEQRLRDLVEQLIAGSS